MSDAWKQAAEAISVRQRLEHELAMERQWRKSFEAREVVYKATIARLERRIADLEMRVGSDSSNSGKPPSSDPPFDKEARRKARNKRKSEKQKKRGAFAPGNRSGAW